MFMDLPVLKVLTRAVEENIEDCSGQHGHKYQNQMKDLFRQIVAAKPSFIEAWRLYARIVMVKIEGALAKYLIYSYASYILLVV